MLDIFTLLFYTSWITLVSLIWFESAAFVEYAELFGVDGYFGVKKYKKALEKDLTLDFPTYLNVRNNNFFTRLLTCPFCSICWLSILCCLKTGFIYLVFFVLLSYILYGSVIKINERH